LKLSGPFLLSISRSENPDESLEYNIPLMWNIYRV
jgi:hypothetical protein